MENLDLSNIDPLKWAEVRRRVRVLARYDALENPTPADRRRYGEMLGLGAQQFTNLHRAWAVHRDALAVAPGLRKRRTTGISRSKRGGVDPRAREMAREVIAEVGPRSTLASLAEAVERRCHELGVTPPSRGTIWQLGMEARGHIPIDAEASEDILVARAHLKLPVDMGADIGIVFPEIIIAVERPSGRILQLAICSPGEVGGEQAIARALRPQQVRHAETIVADATLRDGLVRALPTGTLVRSSAPKVARRALADVLGRYLGRLEIAYKPLRARPDTAMQSARDQAPTRIDAERALRFACDAHNSAIGG
ncbi:MAG: hypothetical protein ACK4SZ_14335 [Allosphingosinicella sp.]|uniref:hypothetical protein n=1 Tax=Allosphingosinicella sp. TaxID=2823234 RepID=UPI003927FDA3